MLEADFARVDTGGDGSIDFEELLKHVSLLELLSLLLFLLFVTLGREDKAEAYFILYAQIVLNGLSELLDFLRWRNFDGLGYAGRGLGRGVDLLLPILFLALLVRLGLSDMSAKGVDDRYFWLVLGLRPCRLRRGWDLITDSHNNGRPIPKPRLVKHGSVLLQDIAAFHLKDKSLWDDGSQLSPSRRLLFNKLLKTLYLDLGVGLDGNRVRKFGKLYVEDKGIMLLPTYLSLQGRIGRQHRVMVSMMTPQV